MHTQIHAPGVPEATIAAQEERNHSREGKWKRVLRKKGFNFHESSVRRVISFSLCLSPRVSLYDSLSLPPHLPPSVSLTLPFFSSPPPGSSTLDMRVWICVCVCVCQCKYPCFSSQITFIFSSSPSFCKAASLEPHLSTESMSSPLPSSFMSPLLFSSSPALRPLAFFTQPLLYKSFRRCSYEV